MKTLIFNGSPRKNGDTAALIRILTANLKGETEVVETASANIRPCRDCRRCWKEPGCAVKDRMRGVYDSIEAADNIVIASPIWFSELTAPLLGVLSRLQTYYCARAFRKEEPIKKPKRGAVILVGGGDGSSERAFETAKVLLHQMNVVDIFPPIVSHNTNTQPAEKDPAAVSGLGVAAAFLNAMAAFEAPEEEGDA